MPKAQRSPEEIEAIKEQMLDHALELIADGGYKGFTMRKLSARLGIAAKTIYNYYRNKDEIYLVILTRGFARLYDRCLSAGCSGQTPMARVAAISRAFVDFGLEQANLYNLMFTWHVPKFNDYVGTPMESVARVELETALKVSSLFVEAIKACAGSAVPMSDEQARFLMVQFWTQGHGYVAGINNNLLDYMHEAPRALKDRLMESIMKHFQMELAEREIEQKTI